MERNEEKMKRQSKVMSIVALAVCVVGLTIGFAAFSNTLTIKSGATVKPNASDFNVEFSTSADSVTYGTITPRLSDELDVDQTGLSGAAIEIKEGVDSISGLSATFTQPGQYLIYDVWTHNTGKYTAYLNAVEFENALNSDSFKKCTPKSGKPNPSVDAACEAIKVYVGYADCGASPEQPVNYDDLKDPYCHTLQSGGTWDFTNGSYVQISYDYEGARADEEFTVEFGDINLIFESVPVNIEDR